LLLAVPLPSPSTTGPKQAQQSGASTSSISPAQDLQARVSSVQRWYQSAAPLLIPSIHPTKINQSISQSTNQPDNQSMNQISIVLLRGVELQVAGQYLEFLVSQDRFEEAAALMPRLLKVPAAACLPFAAHCYQLWVLPPASRPSCSAIL